jgi:hypothetical protein
MTIRGGESSSSLQIFFINSSHGWIILESNSIKGGRIMKKIVVVGLVVGV